MVTLKRGCDNGMSSQLANELFEYGRTLCQMERYSEAKEQLLISEELEHLQYTYYWLYRACKGLGQEDEALKYLALCYNENDMDKRYSMTYAEELVQHGKRREALKVLKKLMDIHGYDEYADELMDDIKEKRI